MRRRRLGILSLTALGVVYGDIGTSPLYAFRACFSPDMGLPRDTGAVYGVLSLIVWSLILVVTVKYILVIMRLDNRGEGGILALLALILQKRMSGLLVGLGLFGAALLYGDGVITPAISVLSALEGIEVALPELRHLVVPGTLAALLLLFMGQRFGTARVGGVFGPIVLQHHVRHNKALQEEVILLAIVTEEVPEVGRRERVTVEPLAHGLYRVRARYGFMERADVEEILEDVRAAGIGAKEEETTYYLGRTRLLPTGPAPMMRWRKRLFALMARNASSAADFFRVPPDRVVELGARVEF